MSDQTGGGGRNCAPFADSGPAPIRSHYPRAALGCRVEVLGHRKRGHFRHRVPILPREPSRRPELSHTHVVSLCGRGKRKTKHRKEPQRHNEKPARKPVCDYWANSLAITGNSFETGSQQPDSRSPGVCLFQNAEGHSSCRPFGAWRNGAIVPGAGRPWLLT